MENRIGFINAIYPFEFLWPLLVSAGLAYLLPIINEKITFLQSKPISRTAVLLAMRRKRALVADISVEKYRAKRDVTYDRHVAGAEKEIQSMREENLASKKRMGEIDAERETLKSELTDVHRLLNNTKENADRSSAESIELQRKNHEIQEINTVLKEKSSKSESDYKRLLQLSSEVEDQNSYLKQDVEKYKNDSHILEKKLKDNENVISNLENEIKMLRRNIYDKNSDYVAFESYTASIPDNDPEKSQKK
ncbi:hypothetical protein [Lelliottia sp. WB101]|uniref:hypothetical protein n=1 Tax=Lelliottia sp. WB101 TaxID=2153385 RepID=UPI00131F28F2|nr:hypothetical protein [Lelliottia sp. WB101]